MIRRAVVVVGFLCLVHCHSSCTEDTGAAPVVIPEGGEKPNLPQGVLPRRPVMTHPIMRMPTSGSAAPPPAPSAS